MVVPQVPKDEDGLQTIKQESDLKRHEPGRKSKAILESETCPSWFCHRDPGQVTQPLGLFRYQSMDDCYHSLMS